MIFTPAEERVLDVLSAKGFDARDLAGLTLEELQDELPTEAFSSQRDRISQPCGLPPLLNPCSRAFSLERSLLSFGLGTGLCSGSLRLRPSWDQSVMSFSTSSFRAQGRRGRTVPASVYNHLRWLTDNLKVSFPLDSPMLKDFTAASGATTTWPTQVKTLSAQVWRHLLQLATSSSTSSLALAAGLVIRFAVSGLRFKHCARASFEPELSSIRTGVWKVSHGKDGMPFAVALPMYVEPGHPLLSHVQARVSAILGVGTPFLPDMWFDAQGSVVLRSAPADYPRFQAFARSLLHLPPLSLTEHAASTFSTRSFRRFLPTVADALQLCDSDRLCLGNWSDGRKLPLPVRYSSERLESAAQVRRLCLASVHHLLKHAPLCDSWSGLRAVAPHVARLRSNIATSSWGPGVRAIPEPDLVESSPVSTERASSSGGSDSPSSDASTEYLLAPAGDAPTDPESVCFVCPAKGLWHAAAEPQSLTPLCSSRVFRQQGIVWATGLTAALDLHGKFCAPCLLKVFPFKSWLSVSDMASGVERFELLLVNEHKVAAEVFHSLKHMGCESVADFVGLYTEADYEDGLKEVLQKTETFKDNRIQLARLRVAWARAKQDLSATSSGPQEENLEAPLPPEVRQRQEDAFFAKYNVRFPPDLLPAATLFARHFRELRRQHKELDDLARVKSAAESSTAPATEVKQLGDFRVVLKAEPPAVSFKDLISLLRAHEILLNSWAMAGTAERDSKLLPGTKVLEFSMSDNLAYRTFAAERLRRYPGTVTQAIQWFLDRDRQTRLAAITLQETDQERIRVLMDEEQKKGDAKKLKLRHGPKCEQKRFELSKCARSECTFLAQHNGGYCCQACAWGGGRHGVQCTDVDLARFALPNRLPLADAAKDRSQRCFVNLQYAEASVFGETKPLCLDLTLPPTADASKGLPCVIFCHGGRWRRGSHKVFMGSVWSELLLSMGWAVASVQYRFLQEAPWPACLADLRCAVRMLRLHAAEFQLDPEWLVAMGHSAGGHLVSALPSDDPFHDADLRHVGEGVSGEVKAIITVAGAFKGMARLTKGNVFELLKADHWPQFLALHGTKDATVPCAMSEDFVAQLVSLKVPAELVRLEGHGHELLPPPKEATAAVAAFLQRLRARG
ncbi:Esterase LipC [Durusdinium trenchii]|uniref:Esterase LipC n=1 Tax=Durusdinium trenchii TaxID=1381693 RepID=A0ABP0LTZ4_9DINO